MDDNKVEIKIELVGYEEIVEKIKNIKKLLNELKDIQIEVK